MIQLVIRALCVCVIFTACKKDASLWKIENLNQNKISVMGHAGMGVHFRFPMNSYESLSTCLSFEVQGTEMDVSVTKDTVMVLYHNQTLEEETTCNGSIKNKNWNELENCSYTLPLFSPSKLIKASSFFDPILNRQDYTFTFDCKVGLNEEEEYLSVFATSLIRHIERYHLEENCLIESFNIHFLQILQAKNKKLRLCLYTSDLASGLQASEELKLFGITLDSKKINAEEVKQAHTHGLRVALFNLSSEKDNREAIEKSPDYLQTDKVEYLIEALRE